MINITWNKKLTFDFAQNFNQESITSGFTLESISGASYTEMG